MKRIVTVLVGILIASVAASALASTPSGPAVARPALFYTVELRKTKIGKILVNPAGSILYAFSKDHAGKDSCVKISGCSAVWPSFPTASKPSAGAGLRASLLSTLKLSDGEMQVQYAGHPLYIYAAAPTATSYVGTKSFGGVWYAVNAKGKLVK
jgi:predicted lipoprotein with Yx(FWY)xxD motif